MPAGYGAGLPELPQPARPPQDSASGYYFLAESGALFSRAGPNVPATPPLPIGDDAVVAHQAANGWTLSHTLTALTILYVAAQLGYLLWKWRNERNERNAKRAAEAQQ